MANRIFVNYRRADSQKPTDRLYAYLCARFGAEQVFRDLNTIGKGYDFADVIDENLRSCAAAVVVIGREWLNIRDAAGGRRLARRHDFVRLEIRALLRRGIPVLPVLVQGTAMPTAEDLPADIRALVRRQIVLLRSREFAVDAAVIARELEAALGFYHGPIGPDLARGLAVLRERIATSRIPPSRPGRTLNIAAWNIRELGHKPRRKASLHYLAEIISQFDLVGVSEAQRYDGDLRAIERILGPFWRVIFSGGFSFIYDSRKVELAGTARQVSGLPVYGRHLTEPVRLPFFRNPFVVSFRAGKTEFACMLVHVRWGTDPVARVGELEFLARWLPQFRRREIGAEQRLIALGTFQTPDVAGREFQALTSGGLCLPAALRRAGASNARRDRTWQQILSFAEDTRLFGRSGGVLDFCANDMAPLYPGIRLNEQQVWRELSDHLPLWVQLKIG